VLRATRATEEGVGTVSGEVARRARGVSVTVAGSTVRIGFEAAGTGEVRASLYDLTGRPLRRVASTGTVPGRCSIVLDASGIPAGTYLVRAGQGNQRRATRVVLGPR
jgi:hypothetical protein